MEQEIKLLHDIVNNTPLPIAIYTGEMLKIELANAAMLLAWGKEGNSIGKNYLEVLPELSGEVFFDQALAVLKTGIPFHATNKKTELMFNGEYHTFYFNYSFVPLFNSSGSVYAVMNTGVDVTDLYLAKMQLQDAEERLRIAIESSGIGTYEIDLYTGKLQTSSNFNSICSAESFDSVAQLIAKLHPDDLPVREKAHHEALQTGKMDYEARIVNVGEPDRWTRITGKILRDSKDVPKTIIGTIQDIAEQHRLQDEMTRQVGDRTAELRRSNEDLMQFAGMVSHDLREPLRKIKIFSGLLNENKAQLDERNVKFLDKIGQSAERMGNIIEGILAYSTIEKTIQPVESVSLNGIFNDIKTDLELLINEKGAILSSCDLPEIEGAPILISQLFYNLVHNALKFSKANEPPRVEITCVSTDVEGKAFVKVSVRDNGIGLDPGYSDKIFGAFERLHSKDEYEGNGLGLALCMKIAKRHHGTISASGEKGTGTTFTVTLPVKQLTATL